MCLATMAYVYIYVVCTLTIISTGCKFHKFLELHVLTQAARSYALLLVIKDHNTTTKDNWGPNIFAGSCPSSYSLHDFCSLWIQLLDPCYFRSLS